MASKRIGALISLEGEQQFKASVQNCKNSISAMKSELTQIQTTYTGNANGLEALSEMQKKYAEIQATAAAQVEKSRAAYEKSAEKEKELKKIKEESLESYKKEQKLLEELKKNSEASADAIAEQEKAVADAQAEYEKYSVAVEKCGARTARFKKDLVEISTEHINATASLKQYTKYVKEAEESADGISESLDAYGKDVKNAGDETSGTAISIAALAKQAGPAGIAIAALAKGTQKLWEEMKKAAKYSVDVGSNFEAAMSNVEALSGAQGTDLDKLQAKAEQIGRDTKYSASEAADALGYMSLAGWKVNDMLAGLPGVMYLASSANMDLAKSSDMVTDNLSAFNMKAKESAYFADMLAYAQSHSNSTVAQFGEAFKNSAANLNAAGQDVQTVTAFLEAFANQGKKGSEAGTALSAMMRDLTANMKDGAVQIGNTAISVSDSEGNFRDLTEIMLEVDRAVGNLGSAERAAALKNVFTDESIKGVNLALNEGIEKISGYEEQLRHVTGTAQSMSDTMQDNLRGSMDELSSATEGLGIRLYDIVDGPMKAFVDGITIGINGITGLITPQKDALDQFIDEIDSFVDRIKNKLENSENSYTENIVNADAMNEYIKIIEGAYEKQKLTEFETFQLNEAIKNLSGDIPELNQYIDNTNSLLTTSSTSFETLRDKMAQSYDAMIAKAVTARREALLLAQADAELARKQAESAQKRKTAEFEEKFDVNLDSGEGHPVLKLLDPAYKNAAWDLKSVNDTVKDAQRAYDDARDAVKEFDEANGDLYKNYDVYVDKNGELKESNTGLIETTEQVSDAIKDSANAYKTAIDSMMQQSVSTKIRDDLANAAAEIANFKENIQNQLTSNFSLFGDFTWYSDQLIESDIEKIKRNMQGNLSHMDLYLQDVESLQKKGMSADFISYLTEQGREGATLLREMAMLPADALQEYQDGFNKYISYAKGTESKVKEVTENYADTILKSIPKGRDAWYEFGIQTTQGLFDAIAEAQNAMKAGLLTGDVNSAMATVLQARQDKMQARAQSQQATAPRHTAENNAPVINVTTQTVLDGEIISEKVSKNIAKINKNTVNRTGRR